MFLRELITLYESFATGQPSPLPELPVQYADYAYWQRQTAQARLFSDQIAYWRQQLHDLPVLNYRVTVLGPLLSRIGEQCIRWRCRLTFPQHFGISASNTE